MWTNCDSAEMSSSINNLFKKSKPTSKRSKIISQRENDANKFLQRIHRQIEEVINRELPYQTPEEWDYSFYLLGGGQSRRKSSAILSRMTWEQFLEKYNEINLKKKEEV